MLRILIISLISILGFQTLFAQELLSGQVLNEEKELLAFVNILINADPNRGLSTDIDGRFTIADAQVGDQLVFSYVGYQDFTLVLSQEQFKQSLRIVLKLKAYALAEALVIAGENPAHRIIRQAIKMRPVHNPEQMEGYRCQTYNKLIFDWLPDEVAIDSFRRKEKKGLMGKRRLENFNEITPTLDQQYLLLMESLTEREFLKPQHLQERVLHNRVSGFKHPTFVALANSVQPFSCYNTHISLLGKKFLNPISEGATKNYFFNLEDTLFRASDTIFVISYHPRKGSSFDGLKGILHIHTHGYAIQSIIGEPADPGAFVLKIEQRYQLVAGRQWFPDQLNFELNAPHYPDPLLGIRLNGRSYIREVELDAGLRLKDFGLEAVTTAPDADNRSDSLWQEIRLEKLTSKEAQTYVFMDSIGEKRKLDRFLGISEILISGVLPIGPFDVNLNRLFGFNQWENTRLGLGLKTSERISQHFTLGGYVGYGMNDEAWKYGVFTDYKLDLRKEIKIGLTYENDLGEPGLREYPLNNAIFSSRNYAFRFDNIEKYDAYVEGWFLPFTFLKLSLEKARWQANYDYQFGLANDPPNNTFDFTELKLGIRYAYGERFTKMLGSRIREESRFPVLQLTYAKGLKGLLGGDYNYDRLLFNLEYTYFFKTFGETYFMLEGAWASAGLPYQKIFDTNGLGRDFRFLLDDHTFHTMEPYEFLSNRFVEFFFRHNFKAVFGKWKFVRPELSVVHNLTFGALDRPELHRGLDFNTLEKGYFEAGVVLDNMICLNYLNVGRIGLGLGGFYRYGAYARTDWRDNLGVQMTLGFEML